MSRAVDATAFLLNLEIFTSLLPNPTETSRAGEAAAALLDHLTVISPLPGP